MLSEKQRGGMGARDRGDGHRVRGEPAQDLSEPAQDLSAEQGWTHSAEITSAGLAALRAADLREQAAKSQLPMFEEVKK